MTLLYWKIFGCFHFLDVFNWFSSFKSRHTLYWASQHCPIQEGIGHLILESILAKAKEVGVKKVFCLTFETKFFGSHGFVEIQGAPVDPEIYAQLLRSYDEGIAEFLDLESVKPNTLGNTRMLKIL